MPGEADSNQVVSSARIEEELRRHSGNRQGCQPRLSTFAAWQLQRLEQGTLGNDCTRLRIYSANKPAGSLTAAMNNSQPYSARNQIPNIQRLGKELINRLDLQHVDPTALNPEQKRDYEHRRKANRRTVIDPTTKSKVVIQDVDTNFERAMLKPQITLPLANLIKAVGNELGDQNAEAVAAHIQRLSGKPYRDILDDLAPPEPNPKKTIEKYIGSLDKVWYFPTPIVDLTAPLNQLHRVTLRLIMATGATLFLLNWLLFGGGTRRVLLTLVEAGAIATAVYLLMLNVQENANNLNWSTERERGLAAMQALAPESSQWMNELISTVWNLINPEMFASMADTLEDVMHASVPPSIVENVKVFNMDQGDHPIRVLSIRALPDADSGNTKLAKLDDAARKKIREERKLEGEDDDGAKYYNLEVSFAYHGVKAEGVVGKAKNMHLHLAFYLGIRGVFGIALPIFAELKGIVGTVRMRFQFVSTPPFIKNFTLTFMGLPKIDVAAVPFTSRGINVLNLPLISSFVNSSIATAINEYAAPRSLVMDLSKILLMDSTKKETDVVGIIHVRIHNAEGLSAQDRSGTSDCYITLAFSQFGKPMFCTRVIVKTLNPSWEEDAFLPVHKTEISSGERLSVQLWDSDRFGKDDMVGRIEFDLHDVIRQSGSMHERSDRLIGEKDGSTMPGHLNWEVGFFPRAKQRPELRTSGQNMRVPEGLRNIEEFKSDHGVISSQKDIDITTIPPDPMYPSGIVSVIVHQIENLEMERPRGTFGNYEDYTPAQITGETISEEGGDLPNSYCVVSVNDETVFRTRTKISSSNPIFSAQTEKFVRDWRNAIVTVSCRHSVHRQHDPLLGFVNLKLSQVLDSSSQIMEMFALDGGIGYGRIQLSILFRSIKITLPRNLLGWDVGSFEVLSKVITGNSPDGSLKDTSITIDTDTADVKVKRRRAVSSAEKEMSWDVSKDRILVPVHARYASAVIFSFQKRLQVHPGAWAVCWLRDLADNETTTLELPVYETSHPLALTQCYVPDVATHKSHPPKQVGTITLQARFKTGMDDMHRNLDRSNLQREAFDVWEASVGEGYRSRIVRRELPDWLRNVEMNEAGSESISDSESKPHESSPNLTPSNGDSSLSSRHTPSLPTEMEPHDDPEMREQFQQSLITAIKSYPDGSVISSPESGRSASRSSSMLDHDDEDSVPGLPEDLSSSDLEDEREQRRVRKLRRRMERSDQIRRHRGMQKFRLARNFRFLRDEVGVGLRLLHNKVALNGRAPDVETEI